jgi:uncharacterized membrane protein YczE
MPEPQFADDLIRSLGTTVAVLQREVAQLCGLEFGHRLTILEQKVGVVEQTLGGVKRFMLGILSALLIAMLLGFVTTFVGMQTRSAYTQQQLDRMERQLNPHVP